MKGFPCVPGPDLVVSLHTRRLILDPLDVADAAAVFRYRSLPSVRRFQMWEPGSPEEVASFLREPGRREWETPGVWHQLGLRERRGGALVGDCGFRCPVEDPRQGEIGITLAPEAQGKGLAAEALRALLEYLFVRRGMHRVFGSVDPENRPCRNLLHRVGMRQEAHFVSSLWFKGAWVDDLVFAMLEREHEPTGERL